MDKSESEPESSAAPVPHQGEGKAAAPRSTALGSTVSADLEALRNDVEQARALACEYQHQLAGKSNDHAMLKALFEKTRDDLIHLQSGVQQLREERHQFANDAMKAAALQLRLDRITRERDHFYDEAQALTKELERLRREGAPPAGSPSTGRTETGRSAEFISVPFFEATTENVTIVPNDPMSASAAAKFKRR